MTSRPPQSPRRPPKTTTVVLMGIGGVVAGVLIFLVVLAIAGPKSTEQSESARFKVGPAERLAPTVERDGPLLFQDLLGRQRDVYVQRVADDDWRAFEARPPGAPRSCVLEWQRQSATFVDPCSGATFPADGQGLVSFPTEIDDNGVVVVNLLAPVDPTTTTTKTTPTPSEGPG